MTDYITIQPPLDQDDAQKLKEEIEIILGQISGHELRLAGSYARLGSKLREVKTHQYWQAWGYERFSSYLEFIREKIDRRRSQIYAILSVAEALLPYLTEDQLETIGINKAQELRRLVKGGGSLSAETRPDLASVQNPAMEAVRLMDFAADPTTTAARLRVAVNNILHCHEGPQGNWIDLGGFYATTDERKELEEFWELGRKVLQIGAEESEHETKKQVMLAAARECRSTWVGDLGYGHN
jgi:hypothetical protein